MMLIFPKFRWMFLTVVIAPIFDVKVYTIPNFNIIDIV
jgi:hypothetical protein